MNALAILIALTAFVTLSAFAQCSSPDVANTVLAIWNNYSLYGEGQSHDCGKDIYENKLEQACHRWMIDDYSILYDDVRSDAPNSGLSNWRDMHNYRVFMSKTDGWDQGTDTDYFATYEACSTAYQNYLTLESSFNMVMGWYSGGWTISWRDSGIASHFWANPNNFDMLMILSHPESEMLIDDYITWPPPEAGASEGYAFVGYVDDYYPEETTQCHNNRRLIEGLGCFQFPSIESSVGESICNTWFCTFYGNLKNRMSCAESCKNWAVRFVDVGACNSKTYWTTIGEDAGSIYLVLGYRSWGRMSHPDTLAAVAGLGTDGYSRLRTYSWSVPADYVAFRIIETNNDEELDTASPIFIRDDAEGTAWEERLAAQRDMPLKTSNRSEQTQAIYRVLDEEGEHVLEPLVTSGIKRTSALTMPPENECGDVVVVGRTIEEVMRFRQHIVQYKAQDGKAEDGVYPIRTASFVIESANPLDAQSAFGATCSANYDWNEWCQYNGGCDRYYPTEDPGPPLFIIGDEHRIHHLSFPDDDVETCFHDCQSDQDIASCFECGSSCANVYRVPCEDLAELDHACTNFDAWNSATEDPAAVLFCGNEYNSEYSYSMAESMQEVADAYIDRGQNAVVLAESDYEHEYACMAAGIQALEQAAAWSDRTEIFLQGFETAPWWLTSFLTQDNVDEIPRNPTLMHAPSCETGAVWFSEDYVTTVVEPAMFQKGLAGATAHLNGDWSNRHEDWRDAWMQAYLDAPPGTSLDLVHWQAKKQFAELHPRYARGIALLGGWLLVPGAASASANTTAEPVFRVTQKSTASSTRFIFELPECAEVTVSMYDIKGRALLRQNMGILAPGTHDYLWTSKDSKGSYVPSGIYFARLVAHGRSHYKHSTKIMVLR